MRSAAHRRHRHDAAEGRRGRRRADHHITCRSQILRVLLPLKGAAFPNAYHVPLMPGYFRIGTKPRATPHASTCNRPHPRSPSRVVGFSARWRPIVGEGVNRVRPRRSVPCPENLSIQIPRHNHWPALISKGIN